MGARKLLIVDLEATCWERAVHDAELMETIEIGALCIDPDAPRAWREFQTFVRPVRTPQLSEFCSKLTTIVQGEVDAADPFPAAFARFTAWIGEPGAVRFASWGSYDRMQFQRDCAFHGVAYPFAADHLNLKQHCSAALRLRPAGMAQALAKAGLELEGTHHRALDDARNIARIAEHVSHGDWGSLVEAPAQR
ncbi:MAG: exonuclease domain-containing protein [Planctomycetes bacterium]|nr:exonuclease domain-containing protein [Planctomycetota bacterium]